MVREIFVQRVERARDGMADEAVIAAALPRAERCLAALAELLGERPCFAGADFSLADAQAAPMFHYLLETPEGGRLLQAQGKLRAWWQRVSARPDRKSTRLNSSH